MLDILPGEEFKFIGRLVTEPFTTRNRDGWFVEFEVQEINNRKIRPEVILIGVDNKRLRQIRYFKKGDLLFVKAIGAEESEKEDVNALNFAFLLDLKLLNKLSDDYEEPIGSYKGFLRDRMHGRY